MLFNRFKLGTKIGIGFGIVLLIAVLAGIGSIIFLNTIKDRTDNLSQVYSKQVDFAGEITVDLQETMFRIRSYALSEDKDYLKQGKDKLSETRNHVAEAIKFAQSKNLKDLDASLESINTKLSEYEQKINETEKKDGVIDSDRVTFDNSAQKYMDSCYAYLKSNINDITKNSLINDCIDLANAVRIANFKGQAARDMSIIQNALKNFDTINDKLNKLRSITKEEQYLNQINEMEKSGQDYKKGLEEFISNWNDMQNVDVERNKISEDTLEAAKILLNSGNTTMKQYADDASKKANTSVWVVGIGLFIALVLGVILVLSITRGITITVNEMKNLMSEAERGNLNVEGKIYSNDEIGELTNSFNNFIKKMREIVKNIADTTVVLNESSDGLIGVSDNMAATSQETSAKTSVVSANVEDITSGIGNIASKLNDTSGNMNIIASAVEEMSGTIRNLASASEQTSSGVNKVTDLVSQISGNINNAADSVKEVSGSVNSVVTAVKEINISLNEISRNCERSINITTDADYKAKDTNGIIERLNESSKQIGKIVSVINDIADQTNMLALNAAIEAAGAGEAGKGFAVVANEVKELAKQTAEATDEIGQQIESMHGNMNDAVKAVETITEVIKEITEITNTIAAAVTEQSATTGEISNAVVRAAEKVNQITSEITDVASKAQIVARSAVEASKGVNEIARSASELSSASNEVAENTEKATVSVQEVAQTSKVVSKDSDEIAHNIQVISAATANTAQGATNTSSSAKELSDIANKLGVLVKQFRI